MKKALGITGIILALAVTVFLLHPRTVRAQSGCTVAALNAPYGFSITGNFYYQDFSTGFLSAVGRMVFDGNGNISGSDATNFDTTAKQGTLTGTYNVNSDCTGTMTFTDSNNNKFNYSLVIVNGGKEIDFAEADANPISNGVAKQQ